MIERDQLSVTQFSASDLRPGSYFWRIRATASSGQTSDWSEPLKFIVMAPEPSYLQSQFQIFQPFFSEATFT